MSLSTTVPSWEAASLVTILTVAVTAAIFLPLMGVSIPFLSKRWSCEGKHIFITGGSQGLGLALAKLVASKGADVTICARSKDKLVQALSEIKKSARSATQKTAYVSADVSTFAGARAALESSTSGAAAAVASMSTSSSEPVGRIPDAIFCCAGGAKPGFFIEQTEEDFEQGIKTVYMTALCTAQAAAKMFAKRGKQDAKIVLVSSTVGLMGLIGYTQYAPMKFAIRGLAETLRAEFQLYGISIHCYFPGTILSPGFIEENKTKPDITKKLEGGENEGLTPERCAQGLLQGVEANRFFFTTDFLTELFRAASCSGGSVPGNNWLLDRGKALIAMIALPIWRLTEESPAITKHRQEHQKQVVDRLSV